MSGLQRAMAQPVRKKKAANDGEAPTGGSYAPVDPRPTLHTRPVGPRPSGKGRKLGAQHHSPSNPLPGNGNQLH